MFIIGQILDKEVYYHKFQKGIKKWDSENFTNNYIDIFTLTAVSKDNVFFKDSRESDKLYDLTNYVKSEDLLKNIDALKVLRNFILSCLRKAKMFFGFDIETVYGNAENEPWTKFFNLLVNYKSNKKFEGSKKAALFLAKSLVYKDMNYRRIESFFSKNDFPVVLGEYVVGYPVYSKSLCLPVKDFLQSVPFNNYNVKPYIVGKKSDVHFANFLNEGGLNARSVVMSSDIFNAFESFCI